MGPIHAEMATVDEQVGIAGGVALLDAEEPAIAKGTLLNRLEDEEVDVSAQRRALHERIDALRAEAGLPPKREATTVAVG